MIEAGRHSIQIDLANHVSAIHPDAVRVVDVPFEVLAHESIEIGSIGETFALSLTVGVYLLRCEFLQIHAAESAKVRLTFAKEEVARFAVVLADPRLSADGELLTVAKPAQY